MADETQPLAAGDTRSNRSTIKPSRTVRLVHRGIALFLALVFAELFATFIYFWKLPVHEALRRVLAGDSGVTISNRKITAHPYLQYVPTPNYANEFGDQHNSQGYRGKPVTYQRKPGVARLLCMGGSTTYGWSADRADEAYPARLEAHLRQAKPASVEDVEVINAGLPLGTTAESLTHYAFKFHYFHPDVVVLEAGGNDSLAYAAPHYQPDYGHWRNGIRLIQPLPWYSRWLMHSRAASLVVIMSFLRDDLSSQQILRMENTPPQAGWYESPGNDNSPPETIPEEYLGYRHNVSTAIDLMLADRCRVLLLAFRPNPVNHYPDVVRAGFVRHEKVMEDLAREKKVPFLRFPAETISQQNWTDDCHLNAAGEEQKAAYVSGMAAELLWSGTKR